MYPLFIALGVIEAVLPPANKNNTTAEMSDITLSGTCTSPISDYNKDKKIRQGEMRMPRGVKGSGKKALAADNTVSEPAIAKTRKPYPSINERIALADQAIERLTKLNASRAGLRADGSEAGGAQGGACEEPGDAGKGRGQESAPAGGKGEARQGGEAEAERGRTQRAPEGSAGEGACGQESGERKVRCAPGCAGPERQDSGRAAG